MPKIVSAKKDLRRTAKRSTFNDRLRNRIKKAVKSFNTHVAKGDVEKAKEMLPKASKVLGKAASKKVIKKGTASRKISRLSIKLNKLITANNVKATGKSA